MVKTLIKSNLELSRILKRDRKRIKLLERELKNKNTTPYRKQIIEMNLRGLKQFVGNRK